MQLEFAATPEVIASLAGALLSLVFSYVPGLSGRFAALQPEHKRLIMAGLMVVVAAGAFGLACFGLLSGLVCDRPGVIQLGWVLVMAITANQAMFQISKRSQHSA